METPTHVGFCWTMNEKKPLAERVLLCKWADKSTSAVTFAELDSAFGEAERKRVVRLAIRGGTFRRHGGQKWHRWTAKVSLFVPMP